MTLENYEIAHSKATDSNSLFSGSINNYLRSLQFWDTINIEQHCWFFENIWKFGM